MRRIGLWYELVHYTHCKCNSGLCGHYCLHKRFYPDFAQNTFYLFLHILNFSFECSYQFWFFIKWDFHQFIFIHVETLRYLLDVVFLVHSDGIKLLYSFQIPLLNIMEFSGIVYMIFLLELQLYSFQLDYIACQYDQIVHIEDFWLQMLVHLYHDVQQMIRFATI